MRETTVQIGGRTWSAHAVAVAAVALLLGAIVAAVTLALPLVVAIGGVAVLVFAVLTLREPYWGVLATLVLEFIRPQQTMPALAALHLPRILTIWVVVAWLLNMVAKRRAHLTTDRQELVMLGLLAVAGISVIEAYWRMQAVQTAYDLAKKIVGFFLIVNLASDQRRVRGLLWTMVALTAYLGYNQLTVYSLAGTDDTLARLGGGTDSFLGNSIDFVVALAVALPYAVSLALTEQRARTRVVAFALAGLLIASVIATGARAGAIGLVALAAIAWVKSRRKLPVLAGFVGLLAVCWLLAPPAYRDRVLSVRDYEQDQSARGRIEAWHVARRMMHDRPLTGIGVGNFSVARAAAYSPPGQPNWLTVHNVVLQAGAEMGFLGLLMFGLALLCVFGDNRRTRRLAADMAPGRAHWYRVVAHGLDASLFGYLVTSMFATTLYYPHLYLIAGVAVALKHAAQHEVASGSAA